LNTLIKIKLKTKIMSLLKKMSFLLFASLLIVSCSSDSDDDTAGGGSTVTISNLDFSVTASGVGNVVSVTPSADGATSYSVDFGTDASDDVLETVGAAVSYSYPTVAASYDILVTASAAGADNVTKTSSYSVVIELSDIVGRWVIKHNEAALRMLNPANLDEQWWANGYADVTKRACFFDDVYVFNDDFSFNNEVGSETWLEGSWDANDEQCGVPYAPFDGTATATWSHDTEEETVTINGLGAFLGFATIQNGKSITVASDAVDTITYSEVTFSEDKNEMTIFINGGTAAWQWTFAREGSEGASLPTTDTDGDGVIDVDDACPTVAGTQADGCPAPQPPTEGATVPSAAQADVLSVFSDSYTGTAPAAWSQSWGNGTLEADLVIGDNTIKEYSNLVFQAINLDGTVDVTSYTTVHIDVFTQTDNVFKFKMANFGADDADEYPNVDDTESEVESTTAQTAGEWVGHDIPLSSFTGLDSQTNIGQLQIILGEKANIWVDNIYFY
jgi:hypothetical protein